MTSEPELALLKKLHLTAKAISFVEKRGRNDFQNYNFAQAVDVTRTVRDELLKRKVIVVPGASGAEHLEYKASQGKAAFLTTLTLHYKFIDVETGATIEVPWIGVGADTGGDKGVYKAYTGGLKYVLLELFLIPTTDDPERDQLSVQPEQEDEGVVEERPAAPRIPIDRAKAILASALKVGMATLDPEAEAGTPPEFHAVFRAKLSLVGAEKVGMLNVDQAEEIEAFLAAEAVPE